MVSQDEIERVHDLTSRRDSSSIEEGFCHLDGEGKGPRFIQFMDAVYGQVAELRAFFADPRVKRMEGGRFSYPRDFPPPDMKPDSAPFKHLSVLVAERPYVKLAQEIMDGYKSIGVKVMVK